MKKLKPQTIRLIASSTSAFICLALLIVSMFAWYVVNKVATVNGGTGVTSDCEYIHFKDKVYAVKYAVNGGEVHTVYTRSSKGELTLDTDTYYAYEVTNVDTDTFDSLKDTIYYKNGDAFKHPTTYSVTTTYFEKTETAPENTAFLFTDNLPGDHIDITFGYYMDDVMDGQSYVIKLTDITGGSFTVDGYTHYSVGVFNYKSVSLTSDETAVSSFNPYQATSVKSTEFVKDGSLYVLDSGTYTAIDSDSELTYSSSTTYYTKDYNRFYRYNVASSDPSVTQKIIMSGTWDKTYYEDGLDYTFSIQEDFTAYYDLIAQASGSYANLLNSLKFNIGNIMIMQG